MAPVQLLVFVAFILGFAFHVNGYTCQDKACIVNCSSTPQQCSNTMINGNDSLLLTVICDGDFLCNHLDIICPQNVNGSDCHLTCSGNHGCTNINFQTLDSNSSIDCGNPHLTNHNATMSICSNISISSHLQSLSQHIALNCTLSSFHAPTCSNISITNIAHPIPLLNLVIICDGASFMPKPAVHVPSCYDFTISHNQLSNMSIYNYFGMQYVRIIDTTADTVTLFNYNELSNLSIPAQRIDTLHIYNNNTSHMHHIHIQPTVTALTNNGFISYLQMHQFETLIIGPSAQLLASNISSFNMPNTLNVSGSVHGCMFFFDQDVDPINHTLTLLHNGYFLNNTMTIHAHSSIIVNGVFENNTIQLIKTNDAFRNVMTMKMNASSMWINNTIIANYTDVLDIKTHSLFSGAIYTNDDCDHFRLRCKNNADVDNTCKNLTLYTAPAQVNGINNTYYPTDLECIGYGCQYISLWSLNGLRDVNFSATDCPCSVNCIDSCMGEWNVYCSNISDANATNIEFNMHALFVDDECDVDQCCGDIINQSEPYFVCLPTLYQNVVCNRSVGLDIALIASLIMAGIIMLFFMFLGFRFVYRKAQRKEASLASKELERKRQMEQDKKQETKKGLKKRKIPDQEPLLAHTNKTE